MVTMDPSGVVAQTETFFFEQRTSRRAPKRYKKLPDELPHDLRFAHLNPRVAAYLANKEKEQKSEFDDGLGSKSLLPQINQTVSLIRQSLNSILSNESDAQRVSFDDSKNNANGVLDQLTRVLYLFDGLKPFVPASLEQQLLLGWKELITETKYTVREWQLPGSREAFEKAMKSEQSSKVTEDRDGLEGDDEIKGRENDGRRTRSKMASRSNPSGTIEEVADTQGRTELTEKYKGQGDGSTPAILLNRNKESQSRVSATPKPKTRLEKYKTSISIGSSKDVRPGSASGSRQSMSMKKSGIRPDDLMSVLAESMSDGARSVLAQPSYMQTIQFQLSSKMCDDRGWIVHPDAKDDHERQTMLEWATQRLQLAIKQKHDNQAIERDLGLSEQPTQVRFYGDSQKEQLQKYKGKGRERTNTALLKGQKPRIPPMLPRAEGKSLLLTTIGDGSSTVYYPSGRSAIVTSRTGLGKPGFYTIIYDNTPEQKVLATFTPAGRGCCYHANGVVNFLATEKGGTMADVNGAIHKRWKWPLAGSKLPVTIKCQLNNQLMFHCSNQSQMFVYFSCQKEQLKFHVGITTGAEEPPTKDDMGHLVSGMIFSSQAAKEFSKPFKPKLQPQPQSKAKRGKGKLMLLLAATRSGVMSADPGRGSPAPRIPDIILEEEEEPRSPIPATELQKLLADFPSDSTDNDVEADKELARLHRKIKNVTEDWLEHYRIAVGISSPHMKTLRDSPRRRHRNINSAKSSPGDTGQVIIESSLTHVPKATVSLRAPSAPAGRTMNRPHSGISEGASEAQPTVKFDDNPPEEITMEDPSPGEQSTPLPPSEYGLSSGPRRLSRIKSAPIRLSTAHLDGLSPSVGLCPVALRMSMLGEERPICHCSRHHVPAVTDIEYDEFMQKHAPPGQLVIVSVVSSVYPEMSQGSEMLQKLNADKNKNRTRPCMQSRSDSFRVLLYDIATAAELSSHSQPLLLRRHNVVPGMFLMYEGGRLFFCDHIFNGYGSARKDLHKQMMKTRRTASMGESLPKDFRFSPQHGRHGARAAWGGMGGGVGTDHHGNQGLFMTKMAVGHQSSASLSSGASGDIPHGLSSSGIDSSMKFVRASLRAAAYDMLPTSPRALQKNKTTPKTSTSRVPVLPPARRTQHPPGVKVR